MDHSTIVSLVTIFHSIYLYCMVIMFKFSNSVRRNNLWKCKKHTFFFSPTIAVPFHKLYSFLMSTHCITIMERDRPENFTDSTAWSNTKTTTVQNWKDKSIEMRLEVKSCLLLFNSIEFPNQNDDHHMGYIDQTDHSSTTMIAKPKWKDSCYIHWSQSIRWQSLKNFPNLDDKNNACDSNEEADDDKKSWEK